MSETRERSALDLLRELEWAGTPIHGEQADGAPVSFARCHFCRRNEEGGHAPDCALDAVLRATPASDGGEVRERALDIVDFLHGAGPLDGRWFFERPAGAGPYWWRRYLAEIRAALLRTPRGEGRSRLFSQADIDFLMVQAEIADLRPVSVSGGEAVADRLRDLGDRLAAALRASNPVEKQNT